MKKALSIRKWIILCAMAGMAVAVPTWAKGKPGGGGSSTSCGYNVTSTIYDTDANFSNLPFQVQSDAQDGGSEVYTNVNGVTSQIQKGCDWTLNLTQQTARKFNLTLDYPDGSNNAPFTGTQAFAGGIVSNCQNNPNNTTNFGTMVSGSSLDCPLDIVFTHGSGQYQIIMDPDGANAVGSTWVHVACTSGTAGDGKPCIGWAVTPVPNYVTNSSGEPAALGELVQVTTTKGKATTTPLGLFYVAFSFSISK